jgi:hypothetical protein
VRTAGRRGAGAPPAEARYKSETQAALTIRHDVQALRLSVRKLRQLVDCDPTDAAIAAAVVRDDGVERRSIRYDSNG